MSDKEMLNYAKAYRALIKATAELSNDSEDQKRFEIIDWLIKQAEQKQKFLERLNKRGIEIKKLKSQLSRFREKIKNLEWNLLVTKGTAEQSMRANKSNYGLVNKLKEENKRLREALEEITKVDLSDGKSREHYQEQAVYMKIKALKALDGENYEL